MTEKKPTPPIVYVLLTLAVVAVGWLLWDTMTSSDRANRQLIDDVEEAERRNRELQEEINKRNQP